MLLLSERVAFEDDVPFAVQIAMMEQKELQMDNNEVTAQFYSHMLACYLIEQDFTKVSSSCCLISYREG